MSFEHCCSYHAFAEKKNVGRGDTLSGLSAPGLEEVFFWVLVANVLSVYLHFQVKVNHLVKIIVSTKPFDH